MARVARLPKPVLFGGFSLVVILVLALKVLTTTTDDVPSSLERGIAANTPPPPATPDNKQLIAKHLADGRARIQRGEYEAAIKEDVELILLVDRTNADALAMKAESEEKLARSARDRQLAETAARAQSVGGGSPPERQRPTPRRDEAARDLRLRLAALATRYEAADRAAQAEDYATAVAAFEAIVQDEPQYRDAAQRLADVRHRQAMLATEIFTAALALEQDDLMRARSELQRACAMPQAPAACEEAAKRLTAKIQSAGNEAFRRARLFDDEGRLPEAIALYERAVQMLPSDDSNRRAARERLVVLKARK